jgi:hypothetical protein
MVDKTDFGKQVAEDEARHLRDYFVETSQWKSLLSGEVDIIYSAKGAGKSALYSLLLSHEEELQKKRIAVSGREPQEEQPFSGSGSPTHPPVRRNSAASANSISFA